MSASERFLQIERQILVGRARGSLVDELEDVLLEESDALWRLMSAEERELANSRIAAAIAASAPASLGLVDRPMPVGSRNPPRVAA